VHLKVFQVLQVLGLAVVLVLVLILVLVLLALVPLSQLRPALW
jgi:hypothetical protein